MNGRNIPLTQAEKLAIILQNTPQGTFPPMNLGQGVGNRGTMADMFGVPKPPQMPPVPQQVPQQGPQAGHTGFAMENVGNINPQNMPPQNKYDQVLTLPFIKEMERMKQAPPNLNNIKNQMGYLGSNTNPSAVLNAGGLGGQVPNKMPPGMIMPNKLVPNDRTGINPKFSNNPFAGNNLTQEGVGRIDPSIGMPIVPTQNNQTDPAHIPDDFWTMKKNNNQNNQQGQVSQDRGMFGMTGFFGDLFNDPRRMAMLSSGLTALDPNSYYDKEGFGSPWTGLRAGLGAGVKGYKSVTDRRKAEAETAKLKAEAGDTMKGQPSSYKEFTIAKKQGYEGSYTGFLREMNRLKAGTESPMAGALKKGYEHTMKQLPDMQIAAEDAVLGLRNLYESKRFLDEGAITGTGAEYITGFHNLLKSRFGYNTGSDVDNTQAFAASMGNQVGQVIKQFGAGTGLSDADREYAEKIVGGKITLTEGAIRELMRIQEKMYRHKIKNYQRKSSPFIKALKEAGGQGLDYSISTEGLDLESTTDWGKKVGKYYDPRRAAMGNYYYKRDADGKITDKKKYRTPQSNPSGVGKAVLAPLNETERNRLEELEKKFGNG